MPAELTVKMLPAKFGLVTPLPNGNGQISFSGSPGTKYISEGSTNLVNWLPIVTPVGHHQSRHDHRYHKLSPPFICIWCSQPRNAAPSCVTAQSANRFTPTWAAFPWALLRNLFEVGECL